MGNTGFFSTTIWLNITSIIGIIFAIYICSLSNNKLLKGNNNNIFPILVIIGAIFYIGTRPTWCYADTYGYTYIFNAVKFGYWAELPQDTLEPLWSGIEYICIELTDASGWLFIVALLYISTRALCIYKIFPKHLLIALLFLITSFLFWSYATNTIRHGVATGFSLLGLTFFISKKKFIIIGYILLYAATLIHKSTLLILIAATIALFYKNTNKYLTMWLSCIVLSLIVPDFFKDFFSKFTDDHRLLAYANNYNENEIYDISYRWDFIIYSSIPIILGWYTIIRRKIFDQKYLFLLHTYLISNSVWVLINNIAFSDRFAYLSWVMSPILIIYPFCKFNLFKNQNVILGMILIAQIIFTYYMA